MDMSIQYSVMALIPKSLKTPTYDISSSPLVLEILP